MGTGHHIVIRQDNIRGLEDFDMVLGYLIHGLNYKGIYFWQQVILTWHDICPIQKWFEELGLIGPTALEWERLRAQLQLAGICRDAERDMIIWRDKMKGANILVVDTYHILYC